MKWFMFHIHLFSVEGGSMQGFIQDFWLGGNLLMHQQSAEM